MAIDARLIRSSLLLVRIARAAGISFVLLALAPRPMLRAQDLSNPELRPVTLTGSLVTSAENYSIPGMSTERPPNTARLFFNPTLTIYGVQLPFSVVLSTNERSYNQPFNQFGVSPTYKSVTLHGGFRSLRLSEFTLSDATILGGGAEVRTTGFHTAAIYGRFRRSIEEDTATGIQPVYTRSGYAAKIGLGSPENFFDLNALHAWDDSTSLARPPTRVQIFPQENLAIGANGRATFAGGKLFVEGELAGSFVTRDTRQPVVKNSDVGALSSGVYDTRLSSRWNMAMKGAATYNADVWGARLEYARVQPDYESFGSSYTQNDREDITIAPNVRLFDGTLRASGSVGFRRDNLFNDRGFTTNRIISSGSLNWAPSQVFGIDGQYSNYSMSNSSATYAVNDTTRVENVSESYSLSPRLMLLGTDMQHFCMLFLTRQAYADRNLLTGSLSNNIVFTAMLSYTATLMSGLGFSGALQFTEVSTAFMTNIIKGVTLGTNRSFFENTLSTGVSYTLNLTQASSESATDTQHLITLMGTYRLSIADQFELRFQYNSYNAENPARRSYAGTNTRLQYTRGFSFGAK